MPEPLSTQKDDLGTVQISNEVIGRIAAMAALEVSGVDGVCQGFRISKRFPALGGVKVQTEDQEVRIGIRITVQYGVNLPKVALQVSEKVRERVEEMTNIGSLDVDVSIHGVKEPKEERR